MDSTCSTGPLAGYRVIDFGQYIAAPAVAMMLADQGAEVIRIDPPGGPWWKTPVNAILNRGKKSMVLDLKNEADHTIARRLIASSDVVVENFRPGVMPRLGLGSTAMARLNPRLVYLSLPGFAGQDHDRAQLQAWEGVVAAATGQFADMGLNRMLMGINPSFSPLPLASAYAAVLGAMAVTLALLARTRDGQGDIIEVPLAAALAEGLAFNSMVVEDLPERYKSLREREIERRQGANLPMDMSYTDVQEYLDPFYRTYVCADDRPFYLVCPSHVDHPVKALQILGLWDEMQQAGIPLEDPYRRTCDWAPGVDCTLRAYPLSKEWAATVATRMKQVFRQHSSVEWEERFGRSGVPGCAHRTTPEWLRSEHALASGLVLEVNDIEYGPMRQAGNVVWLASDTRRVMHKQPAPGLDADRDTILASLPLTGSGSEEAAAHPGPVPTRRWLDGIKILDLANVIAGPTIAATLARFGAEVIRLDPPTPTLDPWNTVIFGLHTNRGKRSLLVDLKTPEGQDILHRLVQDVDMVTANVLDRQLLSLGLDLERLRASNPNVILCQLDAFGGPQLGPRSGAPGYDDLVQASTGIMARFGGSLATPEEHAHLGTIDVLTGFCAAFAIGVALIKRVRGGGADVVRASLAAAGQLIQIPFMYDYGGRAAFDEPSGPHVKGEHALYRCYEARDGWFFLAAKRSRLTDFTSIPELSEITTIPEQERDAYLTQCFKQKSVSHWVETLRRLDVGIHSIETMASVREANLFPEHVSLAELRGRTWAFMRHDPHPSGRRIDLVAPHAVRALNARIDSPAPAPKYGAHTREILAGLGYDTSQIDGLLLQGIIAESWSDDYLPD